MNSSKSPTPKEQIAGLFAKCPKPVLATLAVVVLGAGGFAAWKYSAHLADEATDVFDQEKPKTQTEQKGNEEHDKPKQATTTSAPDLDADANFAGGSLSKSRMTDMAIARIEQMPRLFDHKRLGVASGRSLDSLRIEAKEENVEDLFKKNTEELAFFKRNYGEEHLFVFQALLIQVVLMERLKLDNEQQLIQAAGDWEKLVATLKTANLKTKDGSTSSKDLNEMIKSHGIRRVCRWAHDTGEILAMLLWAHGDNGEAAKIASKIPVVDRLLPFDNLDGTVLVHRLLTLARLCASQNEYVEAKRIISVAKDMAAKQRSAVLLSDAHSRAMCLLEESRLSLAQRDFTAAAELAQQTDNLLRNTVDMETGQSDAIRADILEQLARSLSAFPAKMSAAIENQEKCLHLRQKNFGKDGVYSAATSLDLERMLRLRLLSSGEKPSADSPDAQKCRELLERIIMVCKRNQKSDSEVLRADRNPGVLLSQAYYETAILEAACGNFAKARQNIQQACDIVLKFTEPLFTPYQVATLDALAYLQLNEQKVDDARSTVLKSSKFLNTYVADVLPQLSLSEQIAFADNIESHMNSLLSVCRDDSYLGEIYAEMIRWKGFLIEQFRLRSQIIKQKGNSQIKTLLSSHRQLSSKILSSYVESAQSGNAPQIGGANQKRKEEIERQINSKLRGKQAQSLAITPQSLQSVLAPSEALLDLYEFVRSPWETVSHYGVVIADKSKLRWLDLGDSKTINSAVDSWRSFDGLRSDIVSAKKRSAEDIGPWVDLVKLLYQPLSKAIPANVTQLWIADQSELARLPWSVLMSSYGGSREFQVAQIDSPRELVNLQRDDAGTSGKRSGMLIVGGVDYSKHIPPAPPLKHALSELNEIKSVMGLSHYNTIVQSDFIKGTQPTRKNIIDSLGKCQLAHLVTHGFFNDSDAASSSSELNLPTRNPLIESGLLISRGAILNEEENGFLTAEDMLDANLQGCRLVTLSACETGRGRELSSQGVLGLRSALMGAGADSVMLSLWPVPDKPTSELMKVFYRRMLEGDPPVQALRIAQEAVRKNPKWQAPYYWAAWILVGDGWKKLSKSG